MGEPQVLHVEFEPGVTEGLELLSLGSGRYRLLEPPLLADGVALGDEVETEPRPDGGLRVVRIVARSGWRTSRYLVSRAVAVSSELAELLAQVERLGGSWDQAFGGAVVINLPPGCALDPDVAIEQVYAAAAGIPPAS